MVVLAIAQAHLLQRLSVHCERTDAVLGRVFTADWDDRTGKCVADVYVGDCHYERLGRANRPNQKDFLNASNGRGPDCLHNLALLGGKHEAATVHGQVSYS